MTHVRVRPWDRQSPDRLRPARNSIVANYRQASGRAHLQWSPLTRVIEAALEIGGPRDGRPLNRYKVNPGRGAACFTL